jgi:hypothetical protein
MQNGLRARGVCHDYCFEIHGRSLNYVSIHLGP